MNALARWWRTDDLRGIWATTALALIFAVAATIPLTPHDLWFHIWMLVFHSGTSFLFWRRW